MSNGNKGWNEQNKKHILKYISISVFIGGPQENQLVDGLPSLKELDMKNMKY